jgi:hypothetical protein
LGKCENPNKKWCTHQELNLLIEVLKIQPEPFKT